MTATEVPTRPLEILGRLVSTCLSLPVSSLDSIVEAEVCPDHVHMLVEIPPKMSVSGFVGYLKGKSSLIIYQRYGNLKFKYRNREFWCRGYYVDTVGKNKAKIAEYIRNQLKEDEAVVQMTIDFDEDPFTGS